MALTKNDLNEIRGVVKEEIEERTKNLPTRDEFEARLKNLPTRDEFFTAMDELMGEVKANREENTILNGRTSNQEDRITALEQIHPDGQHSTT